MGFSHEATAHHFRLTQSGGAIEVTANDSNDAETREQIRMQLTHITKMSRRETSTCPCSFTTRIRPAPQR
jgi:hypothetical protein